MGNQQGNVSFNIGYLLGIIDGEGTISLAKCKGYKKGTFKISPLISITNTDKRITDLCINALNLINIPHFITSSQKTKSNKIIYKIIIGGLKRVDKFIKQINGYYFAKGDRLEIVRKFIDSRNKILDEHPAKKPYTLEEINLFNAIRTLNGQGGKSTRLIDPQRLPSGMLKKA